MQSRFAPRPEGVRHAGIGFVTVVLTVVWTHGLAALLRLLLAPGPAVGASSLTVAAVALGLLVAILGARRGALWVLALLATPLALLLAALGAGVSAAALVPAAPAATAAHRALRRWLPAGGLPRGRWLLAGWLGLAVLATVQVARLATFQSDPTAHFCLGTHHPFWYRHQCLSAYLYGAELALRGEDNLYDAAHYPGLHPAARPETAVAGMTPEDPYQYPPQFLLLPRLALLVSRDYVALRTLWFAFNVTLCVAAMVALAAWMQGAAGRRALFLLPGVLAAFPTLYNFQYGQFHLAAVALAVLGMVAFHRERRALGGGFLAGAILAKLFPAVLVVPLLVQRRFRELGWTLGWGAAFTAASLAVFGAAPLESFATYQVPRLGDGSAFAFDEAWPELASLVVADNQGISGMVQKLAWLGVVPADRDLAAGAARVFGLLLLVVAAWLAPRWRRAPRPAQATAWLAMLGLASLCSNGAWGDYVPVTAVWLLAITDWTRGRALAAACAVFQFFLLGTAPLGSWFAAPLFTAVSLAGALLLLLFCAASLARAAAAEPDPSRSGVRDPVSGRSPPLCGPSPP